MSQNKYKIIDNVIYTPDLDSTPDPKGVGHYYFNQMVQNRNERAQIDGYTKEEDTFGAFLERSVRTALTMIDEGIQPGDHISLCTYQHLNSGVPHIASYFTGSIMAAIDPTMSVEEAAYLLKQTLPKIIFVAPCAVPLVVQVVERIETNTKIVVFGETIEHTPFSNFTRPHKNENEFRPRAVQNLDELALIVFSSGTTGMPKGICYSHFSMLSFVKSNHSAVNDKVLYLTSNPYWNVYPLFLHISIEYGIPRIVYPSFNLEDPWRLLYQPVDFGFLNPWQTLQMVRSEKPEIANLKNLKSLQIGGTFTTPKQMDEIRSALPYTLVTHSYSQSEVFVGICCFDYTSYGIELIKKNLNSVGTVMQGFSYKIVDTETGKVLGPNQVGELVVKSSSQFVGYFNKDSSECFDSEGWLKTGDLFYYTEDLYFHIVDRIKESFKIKGQLVYPVEIETAIISLDPIETAVVIPIPHEFDGNQALAVVKLKPNAKKISEKEIVNHVEAQFEEKKHIKGGVRFVDDIPTTVTGKVNRMKLKKIILNNRI